MGARVLIVEDNPDNLELMTYLLRAFGHTTYAAEDGERGVETAVQEQPDLIICDIQLPGIDGHEVARRLKSDPLSRTIPLVAVTALAMVGDRDRVLAAGFDGYITKPISPESFVAQIEGYLRTGPVGPPSEEGSQESAAGSTGVLASPELAAHEHANGPRLLVVDNLPVNLQLSRSILEPFGYRVTTANGLREGLELAQGGAFDLILSDVCMTDGSGFDLIREIRADPRLKQTPFVFITSTYMDEKDRRMGLALGADRFLRRPIEPETLLTEIAGCLERAGGHR